MSEIDLLSGTVVSGNLVECQTRGTASAKI